VAWSVGGKVTYALEGSVFVAGAAVQWLRDEMRLIEEAPDSEWMAAKVKDTCGVYLVPAFAGLGAPYWNPYARGTITGLTRGANKYHIIRATLESLAYQSRDLYEAMLNDAADCGQAPVGASAYTFEAKRTQRRQTCRPPQETDRNQQPPAETILKVDGGACANNFLMQFQSDIISAPVRRPVCIETTALGAAYLAGLHCGYWQSQKEITDNWQMDRQFTPAMEETQRTHLLEGWRKAIKTANSWTD
jgi:glycerol kinase